MSIRWIWGFETGADETFYSGSDWVRCSTAVFPSGSYDQIGYFSDTRNQVDYSCNFPHQPDSTVGGGQYSLKVEPGTIWATEIGQANWQSFQVLSPSVWGSGPVPDTGTLSFSMFNNLDTSQWPITSSGPGTSAEQFGMVQRFLSLYPSDIGVTDATSGSLGASLGLMSGGVLPEVPPMLQLFMVKSSKVAGVGTYNGILAYCVTTTGPIVGAAPWGANWDYVTGVTLAGYSFAEPITASVQAGGGNFAYQTVPQFGGTGYTGSVGNVILSDQWNKIAVEYSPHPTIGSLKVSVNGVDVIDVSGVPTGYTASTNIGGAPGNKVYDNQKWGRACFTSHGFYGNPNPWRSSLTSTLQPATFWYDHVCAFDNATTDDWSAATASIFVDRFVPDQDILTGNYVGNDSGTADLYDYIDDTNYFLNNSYLQTDATSSCLFSLTSINETKAGHPTWSVGNISEIIGLNSINLVSSSVTTAVSGASTLYAAGLGGESVVVGASNLITGKQFTELTTGSTSLGNSWNYLTGNSGGGPGSGIVFGGFDTQN